MDQQITIPDWLVALVGRHVVLAEAQRVNDAATIAALQAEVEKLSPHIVTSDQQEEASG
ncbi:MAG TPA: hypothetical protein VNW96_19190 [Mycobacterium sp.]|jgi:hypothetical protein|nr:hypothetical protein [Mycobacterium sp.]